MSTPRASQSIYPLHYLSKKYGYTPRQPVLSCRTVNIDVAGCRTYESKTADEIISQQQNLIHKVYSDTSGRSSRTSWVAKNRTKICWDEKASDKKVTSSKQPKRPKSSLVRPFSNASSRQTADKKIKRPKSHTGVFSTKTTWNGENFLKLRLDLDLNEQTKSYEDMNRMVYEQWGDAVNRDLDEGIFVKGRKEEQKKEKKTKQHWLRMGSANSANENAVEALKDNTYYSFDGSTGDHVVKTLNTNDHVLIGVNGVNKHNAKSCGFDENIPNEFTTSTARIPLNWDDQLKLRNTKIIRVSPRQKITPPSVSETHAVLVDKEQTESASRGRSKVTNHNFRFQRQSRNQNSGKGTITNIGFHQSRDMDKDDNDVIDYNHLLRQLHKTDRVKSAKKPHPHSAEIVTQINMPQATSTVVPAENDNVEIENIADELEKLNDKTVAEDSESLVCMPMTSHSHMNNFTEMIITAGTDPVSPRPDSPPLFSRPISAASRPQNGAGRKPKSAPKPAEFIQITSKKALSVGRGKKIISRQKASPPHQYKTENVSVVSMSSDEMHFTELEKDVITALTAAEENEANDVKDAIAIPTAFN